MNPPHISMEQMIALHGFFAAAAAAGETALAEITGCETEVDVVEIRCSTLGNFGESGLRLSEDMVAGVMGRVQGAMPGTLTLVVEPEDALAWAQVGAGDRPVETFVELSSQLLIGITGALSEIFESGSEFCDARLVEEPELAMLVRTHAPSDTLVFSARLRIDVRDERITAQTHLLVEPKYLLQLLSGLSAASH